MKEQRHRRIPNSRRITRRQALPYIGMGVLGVFAAWERIQNAKLQSQIDQLKMDSSVKSAPTPAALKNPTPASTVAEKTATPVQTPIDVNKLVTGPFDLKKLETDDLRFKKEIITRADEIMALSPSHAEDNFKDLDTRVKKETSLFDFLEKSKAGPADVLLALNASYTRMGRAWGMQLLFDLRQNGSLAQYGIVPLDQARKDWCEKYEMKISFVPGIVNTYNLDPRVLAIARDVFTPSLELLDAGRDNFFEALPPSERSKIKVADRIPTPALITALQMVETGTYHPSIGERPTKGDVEQVFPTVRALVSLGGRLAWDELNLNPGNYPSGRDDLDYISKELEQQFNLPFVKNIKLLPGSQKGGGDSSGGAIGPQFMPIYWRLFSGWYKEANKKLGDKYPFPSPFDPITSLIMVNLYLSSTTYMRQDRVDNVLNSIVRPGYIVGDTGAMTSSLAKWNPDEGEIQAVLKAGTDYFNIFGRL